MGLLLAGRIVSEYADAEEHRGTRIGDAIIAEELEEYHERNVYACYAFSDEPITADSLITMAIMQSIGEVDAEYRGCYSDITGYLWTDENGVIGGHDIVSIFDSHDGEYGCLIVDTDPIDLDTVSGRFASHTAVRSEW